ncbi:MAG: type II secretion system protein GspE, partial [Chloroflexi bacterium]|nr:type II secretion system protein GspE [Chloroflexota bacterium]
MKIGDKGQRGSQAEKTNVDPAVDLAKEKLGEVLVSNDMLTAEQLQTALDIARREGKVVGQVLIEKGWLTSHDLTTALSIQMGIPLVDLKRHKIRPEALKLVPEQLARKYNVLPLDIIGGALALVMENPMDVRGIDDIAAVSKMRIEPMMAFADDIRSAIDRNYTVRARVTEKPSSVSDAETKEEAEVDDVLVPEAEAPALRNLNIMIQQAARQRASDIHIEPHDDKLQVRFRIDGVLQDTMSLPLSEHAALLSRLKIMSGMNIAERRRPQDGRFSARADDKEFDVRVACANTVYGEMAVLRLLPKSGLMLDLAGLGFLQGTLEKYKRVIGFPFGMIILGGPTGSGKTTTLYASINMLNRIERNIMTIEDPVEYQFAGINQFQVNPKAGVDFAT